MKLFILRNQKKGVFRGIKYTFLARVELTPDEAALIKDYKANKEILLNKKKIVIPNTGKKISFKVTIGNLIDGYNNKYHDMAEVLEAEKNIKDACETFSKYIEIIKSLGNEETLDYHPGKSRIKKAPEIEQVVMT